MNCPQCKRPLMVADVDGDRRQVILSRVVREGDPLEAKCRRCRIWVAIPGWKLVKA